MTRDEVVAAARGWLGTRYAHQGRLRRVGVDCAGLVIGVARELGIVEKRFDVNGYARTPDGVSLMAECSRFMLRIPVRDGSPGDVIVGRFENDPQHLAFLGDYLHGGLSLIHALNRSSGRGSVIEQRLDPRLPFKPVACFVLPGIE